jgi:hypothetical protein
VAPVRENLDLHHRLGESLIEPFWSPALHQTVQGQGVVNPRIFGHTQLGLFSGEPTPRFYDRVAEVLRTRLWRSPLRPTTTGFIQIRLDVS